MAFGAKLSGEFRTHATPYIRSAATIREVNLFRHLIDAIKSVSGYSVAEIHGNKSQVTYKETMGWFTKTPRCELGDVCVIAYSKVRRAARLVIIQNKVAPKTGGVLPQVGNKIRASLVQHELLSCRPYFECWSRGGGKKGWIHDSPYPSVCIYGNFIQDGTGEADMVSITADQFVVPCIGTPKTGKKPSATVYYSGMYEELLRKGPSGDFVAAKNLVDFGDLLEDLYIGRPIDPGLKHDIEDALGITFFTNPTQASENFPAVLKDFQEMELSDNVSFGQGNNLNIEGGSEQIIDNLLNACRVLLLLNVDGDDSANTMPLSNCSASQEKVAVHQIHQDR